jgi:hypothetical protein
MSILDNIYNIPAPQKEGLNLLFDMLFHSDDAGNNQSDFGSPVNPDSNNGYHYNESDGKWYTDVYPDVPASSDMQSSLNQYRVNAERYNDLYSDVISYRPDVSIDDGGAITVNSPDGTTTIYNTDKSHTTFNSDNSVTYTSPDGVTTNIFTYNGDSFTYTSPDGSVTTIDKDTGDRTTTRTDASGNVTTTTTSVGVF